MTTRREERMDSTIYVLWDREDREKIIKELRALGWESHGLVELWDSTNKALSVVVMLRTTK